MRFTSPTSRPSLTPMGYRLLHLSELKLANLDGISYDEGKALLKGVVVREAVRSAWKSVEEGSVVEMNDWSSRGAMGLDVVSEEEEDEGEGMEESKEQQWFEDLMSTFGEEEQTYFDEPQAEHEWVESDVSMPDFQDFEYDTGAMIAYTLPLPVSPTTPPTVPTLVSRPITIDSLPTVVTSTTDVDIVEVEDDEELSGDPVYVRVPSSSTVERVVSDVGSEPVDPYHHRRPLTPVPSPILMSVSPMYLDPRLTPPYIDRPTPADYYSDLDDCVDIDEIELPPPLVRSLTYSSTTSHEDDDDECGTPPLRFSELDEVDVDMEVEVGDGLGSGSIWAEREVEKGVCEELEVGVSGIDISFDFGSWFVR